MKNYVKGYLAGIVSTILIFSSIAVFSESVLSTISVELNKINISVNGKSVARVGDMYVLDNGKKVPYSILFEGTTYLPMRKLGSLAGKSIAWDGATSTAGLNDSIYAVPNQTPPSPVPSTPTLGQKNALEKAQSYLKTLSFSRTGLIEQLEFSGFTTEEATFAVDNCGANWFEQAGKKAQSYLKSSSFSRTGLIEQLEFSGFTKEEAEYGAKVVGY